MRFGRTQVAPRWLSCKSRGPKTCGSPARFRLERKVPLSPLPPVYKVDPPGSTAQAAACQHWTWGRGARSWQSARPRGQLVSAQPGNANCAFSGKTRGKTCPKTCASRRLRERRDSATQKDRQTLLFLNSRLARRRRDVGAKGTQLTVSAAARAASLSLAGQRETVRFRGRRVEDVPKDVCIAASSWKT